jgi:hypothetical protein
MKQLFFLLTAITISSGIFAQKKDANIFQNQKIDTIKQWNGFSEPQMVSLFQLLQHAKKALPLSDDISAHGMTMLNQFADSLSAELQKQYVLWHPAPKQKDTSIKK